MKFPTSPSRWPAITAATLLISFVIGCASPGPPLPPSLHLPKIVRDLTAERNGDAVTLRWTTPSRTTDDLDIKGPLTAEICRQAGSASSQQTTTPGPGCVPIKRVPVHPGPTETADTLPAPLTVDPAALLRYRVSLFNTSGRTAGASGPAFAAAGAAPPAVEHFQVTPVREGAMLEWQPRTSQSIVELDRTLIQAKIPHTPSSRQSSKLTPSTPAEVHLQANDLSSDSGGIIDPTAHWGETYRYTAQRVRSVTLDGHTLGLRGVASPAITVTLRDTFPPVAPTGLAAIPGAAHTIDLSWEPVPDTDVTGYIVYRQPIAPAGTPAGPSLRVSASPVTGPAFSDHTAVPGQTYLYRVTAIDAAGNESAPSAGVQETEP